MELYCSFANYPDVDELSDDDMPFPDITAGHFHDMGAILEIATAELPAREQEVARKSLLKIFAEKGDIEMPPDEDEGVESVGFSPQFAGEIATAADTLSKDALSDAISSAIRNDHLERFESDDHFMEYLDEILSVFREAASSGQAIVLTFC